MKKFIPILFFAVAFTLTGFGQSKPGVDQQVKILKCYPTPASSSVVFDFQRTVDRSFSIQLYNFMGKKVYELKVPSQHIVLPLNDFYRGIYVYQLRDRSGKILQSGKFQVIK